MRYNQILNEYIIKLKLHGGDVTILKNPHKYQIINMFKQSIQQVNAFWSEKKLRGIVGFGDIYVWDAWDGMHFDIFNQLNREGWLEKGIDKTSTSFYFEQRNNSIIAIDTDDNEIESYRVLSPGHEIIMQYLQKWNSQ